LTSCSSRRCQPDYTSETSSSGRTRTSFVTRRQHTTTVSMSTRRPVARQDNSGTCQLGRLLLPVPPGNGRHPDCCSLKPAPGRFTPGLAQLSA
jgi:hypothetical protein